MTPYSCDYFFLVDLSPHTFYMLVGDTEEDSGTGGLRDNFISVQYSAYIFLLISKTHLETKCVFDTLK